MHQWEATITGRQPMVLRRLTDRLGVSVRLPCPVRATNGDLILTGKLDFQNGRFGIWEMTISSASGPVTGEKLRQVPVGDIVRSLANRVVLTSRSDGRTIRQAPLGPPPARSAGRGPSAEELEYLSDIYSLAAAVGDPPTKAAAAALGISVPTATRWANRARANDLLPPLSDEED